MALAEEKEQELRHSIGNGLFEAVGAGNCVATLYKRWEEPEKWNYWFRLLRAEQTTPTTYSTAFQPADLLDLPGLVKVLATVIVQDGCLEESLKDELACLASGLEWFLSVRRPDRGSSWVVVKRKPLQTLIDYLWQDEQHAFEMSSSVEKQGHIFRDLADLNGILHAAPRTAEEYLEEEEEE